MSEFTITDLRECPEFFDTVADRIWRAWWEPKGIPVSYILWRLRENMNAEQLPVAFVAHRGATFLGTSSLLASDLEEMPQYTPWVGAVWVDPESREQQVGRALVRCAADAGFAQGVARVYLCAPPRRRNFYLRQGWQPIHDDVGPRNVTVFAMEPATAQ